LPPHASPSAATKPMYRRDRIVRWCRPPGQSGQAQPARCLRMASPRCMAPWESSDSTTPTKRARQGDLRLLGTPAGRAGAAAQRRGPRPNEQRSGCLRFPRAATFVPTPVLELHAPGVRRPGGPGLFPRTEVHPAPSRL
jgi:hypothetical protein